MRFNFLSGKGSKIAKTISFPKSVNFRVFISENMDSDAPKENQIPYIYDLIGVIVHIGQGLRSGHYISYVRATNNEWYSCNDSIVKKVKIEDVLKT